MHLLTTFQMGVSALPDQKMLRCIELLASLVAHREP